MTVSEASSPADGFVPLITDRKLRLFVYSILMTAFFMSTMDNQIVATALPTIVGEFGQLERFGWVGSAYLLTSSVLMPIYGKLGDLFGRKYVIMVAITIFTIGSLICGMAYSMNSLIAARVLQAIGGGGIMVSIFSINADLFRPRERAKYQSYSSLVLMLSGAIGPTLGGIMTSLFGWRSIFYINVPFGIFVLIGLAFFLPYKRPHRVPKIDYVGAILLAGAIGSVVLWADGSDLFGGLLSRQSLTILVIGVACLFGWIQVARKVQEPVVPLTLFRSPTVSLLLWISVMSGMIAIGMSNYYALFLQSGLGMSPALAGVLYIPLTTGIAIGSMTSGHFISRSGYYKNFAILSTALSVIALGLYGLVGSGVPIFLVAGIMLMQGIGVGVGQQIPVLGVQEAARREDTGAATSTVTLTRMGGGAIGISIYGAIIASHVKSFTGSIPGVDDIEQLTPAVMAHLSPASRQMVADVYSAACHPMFFTAALICSLAFLAALILPNVRLPVRYGPDD